jgi:hypothetical protein
MPPSMRKNGPHSPAVSGNLVRMSDKAQPKRKSHKKARPPQPAADGLTIVWMTTFMTAVITEVSAFAIRAYVRWGDPSARLLGMLSSYLLLAGALIGIFLIVLTPIVVRRGRSNPPLAIVIAAYIVGAIPLLAMVMQGT